MAVGQDSVSIIIPTSGRPTHLSGCLKSILSQEIPLEKWEVIVVENGYQACCLQVVDSFVPRLPMRYFYQRGKSAAAARNRGAHLAKGDILVFLDDDCFAQANWLRAILGPFKEPRIVAVGGQYLPPDKGIMSRYLQSRGILSEPPRENGTVFYLLTGNMAIRKETFFSIGGFDEGFKRCGGEDADLGYRLRERGIVLVYEPEAKVTHAHPATICSFLARFYGYGRGHAYFMRRATRRERLIGLIYLIIDWTRTLPCPLKALITTPEGAQDWRVGFIFSCLDLLRKSAAMLGTLREIELLLRP